MDDFAPFESPKLLIDGAKASIDDFKLSCDSFIQNCTYDTIQYEDPKTRDHVVKLRFHHRTPPKLRLAAYRILNDLRHALDQAVCDGAIALGRASAKGVYFPFGRTQENLTEEIKKKCKNVHPRLVEFIAAFKPHYGGDDTLYALSSLAGPNKHQRVIRVSLFTSGGELFPDGTHFFIPHHATGRTNLAVKKWNDLRNELEFMRFGFGTYGQINAAPTLQIVIGEGEPPLSGPASSSLDTLAGKVEGVVLGIEAETARLLTLKT